jgi:hypothetical protein
MGRYITTNDVQIRLLGKVKFTDDPADVNSMQNTLLRNLIDQAESQVEYDLSPRYAAPFQSIAGAPFNKQNIPNPAFGLVQTLCQLQSVQFVLETDFGRGTAISSDKYIERIVDRYKDVVQEKILKKKDLGPMETQQWKYPPLPLKLNYFNTEADDGYMGQVLNTTQTVPQYPQFQINDPSETYWNGIFDDPNVSPTGQQGGAIINTGGRFG